jgi:F-type H+-transporting ATPase subunit alpha
LRVYLSPRLHQKGILPAVDVGRSVSRVGGKTQLPAYRDVAGDLKLSYSQFEELESFSRFSTRLDEETRKTLERGRRVREALKQPQYQPLSVIEELAALLAVTEGLYDDIAVSDMGAVEKKVLSVAREEFEDTHDAVLKGNELTDEQRKTILDRLRKVIEEANKEEDTDADS